MVNVMHQSPLPRQATAPGFMAFAALRNAAVSPLPMHDNREFAAAVVRYQQVCERMRHHQGCALPDDILDTDLDLLEDAAKDLLRTPAHGVAEALILLTICHFRMYGALAGVERGFFGEIERLDLGQELTWGEQDRAFLEAAINALKGGC